MALRKITEEEFRKLCPNITLPLSVVADSWYATDRNELAALIGRHSGDLTWQYHVFSTQQTHISRPVASANHFHRRPEPELRKKLQEVLHRHTLE